MINMKIPNELIKSNHVVLDMCVGDGIHSVTPAKRAKSYYAVEPSISGLKILEKTSEIEYKKL